MPTTFDHGYALIIGVGADLPTTVDDAKAIAAQLQNPARCAYPTEQVRLLTGEQAQAEPIRDGLRWLAKAARPSDTAIVYFSGHGIETPDYHLVPFGFDWNNLAGTAITGAEFTEHLRAIQAGKLLVLLDCCYAGGLADAKGVTKSPLPPDVLSSFAVGSGRVVVASSRRDEKSLVSWPYSVFTNGVLEALAGYGAFEQDGYARVLDLVLWVGRKTPERTGDKQHPIVKVSNLSDNFALAWYAGGAKSMTPLSWQAATSPTPSTASGVSAAQRRTWQTMLGNYRESLLLLEERMSEFVEFTEIPLQYIKNRRQTEAKIADLEAKIALE
jgi:hypothetical protein